MPRVSVVIPNYNHAAYIVETLDHVFRQTFEDWELIVVDDVRRTRRSKSSAGTSPT
jgi:glycosyltransferase involved in cell wall biosynthesis